MKTQQQTYKAYVISVVLALNNQRYRPRARKQRTKYSVLRGISLLLRLLYASSSQLVHAPSYARTEGLPDILQTKAFPMSSQHRRAQLFLLLLLLAARSQCVLDAYYVTLALMLPTRAFSRSYCAWQYDRLSASYSNTVISPSVCLFVRL